MIATSLDEGDVKRGKVAATWSSGEVNASETGKKKALMNQGLPQGIKKEGQEHYSVNTAVCVSWLGAWQVTTASIHLV
ncbi:hypothetical protein N7298_18910, partial [Aeromonas caviae]|uniref:hypothetical protein n=1 Tax=Aeromonas caviae TaxID=648 RepID=UPI00244A5E6F